MTEKKLQSTIQSEQTQGFNSLAEDEIDLIGLLKFLARKKVFILVVTSVFTLFSIFYAQSITPVYRATVGLLNHKENFSSFSVLEQLGLDKVNHQTNKPLNIFERFLFNIRSYELKQEVFVKGGFQKKISNETAIDTDQSVSATYNSIKIVKHDGDTYLELEGSKPKVMLEFLTALVEAAKENVNTEINNIQRSTVKTKINNLSTQIEELNQQITVQAQIEKKKKVLEMEELYQKKAIEIEKLRQQITVQTQIEKKKKVMEIVRLSKALDMAKRMGIKNNNFDKPDNDSFPNWFRYGELALQQQITSLRSKKEISTQNLSIAKLKLEMLQQETTSLRSKKEESSKNKNLSIEQLKLTRVKQKITSLRSKEKEISKNKNLSIEQLKLKKSQTTDLLLLKFKIVTIGKHSYSLVKPNQTLMIIGFGVAFGLFISIFMAFLIDLKQLRAKEFTSSST